jgi:hypothetical protein
METALSYVGAQDPEVLWRMLKWGKFSASEINDLMLPGKGTTFSEGGETYIERVAREGYTLFNDSENSESRAMQNGKKKEPEAFGYYYRLLGCPPQMEYFGGSNPYFELYNEESGASPDSLMWIDKSVKSVSFGTEFKCPSSKLHWKYLTKVKDQWDLKTIDPQYYGQCQFGMMVFKTNLWHWVSYNEYYPPESRIHIIEVSADEKYQRDLDVRLKMAISKKNGIIKEMRERFKQVA